jgi:hypothetical protein
MHHRSNDELLAANWGLRVDLLTWSQHIRCAVGHSQARLMQIDRRAGQGAQNQLRLHGVTTTMLSPDQDAEAHRPKEWESSTCRVL